jgi:histidinol-phosphate aminotransferase
MSVSRRSFFRSVGAGSAVLSADFIIGRGHEAQAFELEALQPPDDGGFIRIDSNENPRGPGRAAIEAIRNATTARMGRGYAPDHVMEFYTTVAEIYGVDRTHVIAATGSGPILDATTRAFCAMDKPLGLDVDAMAAAAQGAGLVFFCNPNNPTGTAHSAATVEKFIRGLAASSPGTKILVDEAYIDYAHDPSVTTLAALAKELPSVIVARTFSKAHGMAGLRLGYALGQPDTLRAVSNAWGLGSIGTLTAAAATASLRDTAHMAEERAENARIRDFTLQAFRDMGFEGTNANTNCVFVDIKRTAKEFRDACAVEKVRVGRDFPPFEKSHTRITLGTMDEMKQAVAVFRKVLTASPSSRAQ